MAAVDDVDFELLSGAPGPVRSFAGDIGIDAFEMGIGCFLTCTAGDDSDGGRRFWAKGEELTGGTEFFFEEGFEFFAMDFAGAPKADHLAFQLHKRFDCFEAKHLCQESIIADFRVSIQRQVDAVEGDIVSDHVADHFIAPTGPGLEAAPEKTVVDQHEIGFDFAGHPESIGADIDGGGDSGDAAGIGDLETVHCLGPVFELGDAEKVLAVGDNFIEGDFFHH